MDTPLKKQSLTDITYVIVNLQPKFRLSTLEKFSVWFIGQIV